MLDQLKHSQDDTTAAVKCDYWELRSLVKLSAGKRKRSERRRHPLSLASCSPTLKAVLCVDFWTRQAVAPPWLAILAACSATATLASIHITLASHSTASSYFQPHTSTMYHVTVRNLGIALGIKPGCELLVSQPLVWRRKCVITTCRRRAGNAQPGTLALRSPSHTGSAIELQVDLGSVFSCHH